MKKIITPGILRILAIVMVVTGAGYSLILVLHAGRHNNSVLLPVLFVGWVLSPFMGLLIATVIAKGWPVNKRVILYIAMIIITLGSLVSYSGVLSPPGTKLTGVFLIVPLLSWIITAIVIWMAALRSPKSNIV